jgi:hypothetical protein
MNSCPVSFITVDENSIRINAAFNGIITIILMVTPFLPLFIFFVLDFFIKSISSKKSPLSMLARFINSKLNLIPNPTDAGAKIFAARLGFIMLFIALMVELLGFSFEAKIILAIFFVCTFLEGTVSFCVGCLIYRYLPRRS